MRKPFTLTLSAESREFGRSEHPRISAFKGNPLAEAMASKLVQSALPNASSNDGKLGQVQPPMALVTGVTSRTASNVNDATNMRQVLPDMELASQVLVSSIISPNDMMSTELNFTSTADELAELLPVLLEIPKKYFKETYKIEDQLANILDLCLFKQGAYPLAILPEAAIDEIINSDKVISTESLTNVMSEDFKNDGQPKSWGFLGASTVTWDKGIPSHRTTSFESLTKSFDPTADVGTKMGCLDVHVTDNLSVLKIPFVQDKMVNQRLAARMNVRDMAMESVATSLNTKSPDGKKTPEMIEQERRELRAKLYRPRNFKYTPIVAVKSLSQLDKETVGHPMIMTLPAESVIPVHVPGSPEEHIGYFIAVDRHGNPIKVNQSQDFFAEMNYNINVAKEMSSQLLAQTRRAAEGKQMANDMMLEETQRMFNEVAEAELTSRLINGIYGDNVKVSNAPMLYRVMLARMLQRQMTQLIYVPVSLMTYIAFDYNDFGVGKSLLEETKILGSIRAILLFSNTMAAIKNSVQHVNIGIEFDPNDPDPSRTLETAMHEYMKTRVTQFPIGSTNPLDITSFIQNAGIQIQTSGHPAMPETKFNVEERSTNHAKVDTELSEELKKRHLQSLGIAPETVDLSMNVDFATSVVSSNILLAKRAMLYQDKLCSFLEDFIRKYIINSSSLLERIVKTIDANREKVASLEKYKDLDTMRLAAFFIESIKVMLPRPDMSQIEMQSAAFDNFNKLLDATLPAFVSSDLFDTSLMGEVGNSLDKAIAATKAAFQRQWLQDNNVMPQLFKLVTADAADNDAFDLMRTTKTLQDGLANSLLKFMKVEMVAAAKRDKELQKVKDATGVEPGGGSSGGDDSGGSGTDDGGGGDDSFDFGGGGDETPPEGEDNADNPPEEGGDNTETPPKEEGEDTKPEEEADKGNKEEPAE